MLNVDKNVGKIKVVPSQVMKARGEPWYSYAHS
jgi:hypothetical protein